MSDFAITISCKLNPTDQSETVFVLDTVNDNTINSSSTITNHPIVTGDMIADHMYINPDSLSINGSFSLNGSKGIVIDSSGSKLKNVEELFEKIKREGIHCTIVKVFLSESQSNLNDGPRFKIRHNMVLTNIQWTERINSLNFSFTFNQALVADVQTYDVDISDQYLPNVSEPATLSFTDTLIDWNQIDSIIVSQLNSFNLITDEFLNYLKTMTSASLIAIGVAAVIAKVVIAIPYVREAVAILAVGYIIGKAIYTWIDGLVKRKKYRIEQFQYYKDDKKNKQEVKRFSNFIGQIHKNIEQLNNALKVYSITSNEPQECMLSIDNNYYIFTFKRDNTTNKYSLVITDIDDNVRGVKNDITSAFENIGQCTSKNSIFKADEGGSSIYLMCPDDNKSDLTKYYILVSSMDLDKYNDSIRKIIENALTY